MSVLTISLQQRDTGILPLKWKNYEKTIRVKKKFLLPSYIFLFQSVGFHTIIVLLFLKAVGAVQLKQTFHDRVIYTLSIPQATSQDSGTYECSITCNISGKARVSSVGVTVFGKSSSRNISWIRLMSFQQNYNNLESLKSHLIFPSSFR